MNIPSIPEVEAHDPDTLKIPPRPPRPRQATARAEPTRRFRRVSWVASRYGVSTATIWNWARKGIIPAPVKLSQQVTAWDEGAVEADIARKSASNAHEGGHDELTR